MTKAKTDPTDKSTKNAGLKRTMRLISDKCKTQIFDPHRLIEDSSRFSRSLGLINGIRVCLKNIQQSTYQYENQCILPGRGD
jgi:hypothetical protein